MINICNKFKINSSAKTVTPYGMGHINRTYLVVCEDGTKYILQKINNSIFTDVDGLMSNIALVTEHIQKTSRADESTKLRIIPTIDGKLYFNNEEGYYRMYNFLPGTTVETGATTRQFALAGKGFGQFQNVLSEFDASSLTEPIKNFHNTEWRYENLIKAVNSDRCGRAAECEKEIEFYTSRKEYASRVLSLLRSGEMPLRVTHNDTKPNNVLVDEAEGKVIAVIDLDTIMPGSVLYDFGDSIRYGANTGAEDETELSKVTFSMDYFEAYCKGFLPEVVNNLTYCEKVNIPFAGILMTYECGMRFLTDYLEGDTYFHISREKHNLDRTHTQMKMIEEMERLMPEITAVANKYCGL